MELNTIIIILVVMVCLFIFFILFMAILYKIATKEGGWLDLGSNSYYENRDTGARGSFRKKIDSDDGATTDVCYSPLNNPFHSEWDRDIPIANITDEIPGFIDKPGVQNRYVVVTANKHGECRMDEKIGLHIDKKAAILSKKLRSQTTQTKIAESDRDNATKNIDEHLSKIMDRKPGQQRGGLGESSPYGWFNRRRDFEDEGY